MAQFAPVASLPVYQQLAARGQLGAYHLLIATEVLKDPVAWQTFWLQRDQGFLIMDNGLIETGRPTTPDELCVAARLTGASCIVLPDALGDYQETRRLVREALAQDPDFGGYPLLGVVQGRTVHEVQDCVHLYRSVGVKYLALPRVMTSIFGTRQILAQLVYEIAGLPIHLLGFSDNIYDDMLCSALPGVMGIDSAVPLWIAWNPKREYLPVSPPRDTKALYGSRPPDYWTYVPDNEMDIATANVRKVRSWIRLAANTALLG
jgi:hypothetical protein